jgi:hypothetical protein
MTTFFSNGTLGTTSALIAAAFIGVAFGFVLERAGFGSSKKLVSIFYLRDFAVFKVMFTAIVVAMFGSRLLAWTGVVNLDHWYQLETFLLPQTIAGLVFGVGFVMGGWCPGTALVGAVSGRGDALLFLGGVSLGSLLYAFVFPSIEAFSAHGGGGVSTLHDALGLSPGVMALIVGALAVAAFVGSDRLVAWNARRALTTRSTT